MRNPKTLPELLQAFYDRLESREFTAREAMEIEPILKKIIEYDFGS